MTSLHQQTRVPDAIYLALPTKATRLNKEYPPLPQELSSLCTVVPTPIDYGPITKIYGALVSETDPNTVIISCDDDVFFPPNFIEKLLEHHQKQPNVCICGTGALLGRGLLFISIVSTVHPFPDWNRWIGFDVPAEGRNVDLIFGVAGVLYRRGFFPAASELEKELLSYSMNDQAIFHNDDVLISGYLSKHNIARKVFADIPTIHHLNGDDALSGDIVKMIMRLNEAISKVKSYGFFPQMENVPIEETPAGRVLLTILIIIAIIIGCYLLYRRLPTTTTSER